MSTFLDYLTVTAVFVILALPSLGWHAHERRIDRQLAQRSSGREPAGSTRGSGPPVPRAAVMSSSTIAS